MPKGRKSSHATKQKRRAQHSEEGSKKKGMSAKGAARRGWATVSRDSGGGKKAWSGRKRQSHSLSSMRRAA